MRLLWLLAAIICGLALAGVSGVHVLAAITPIQAGLTVGLVFCLGGTGLIPPGPEW